MLSLLPNTKDTFNKAAQMFVRSFREKGFVVSVIGPVMLGIGITLAGSVSSFISQKLI